MSENRPRNIDTSGILNLMRSGGSFARMFDDGPKASLTDPIKMYRGEALRKSTETLVPDELVGKFNTPYPKKARRYPEDFALGGKITRSFETTAEDLVKKAYDAHIYHGKVALDLNLAKGVPSDKASSLFAEYANEVDDFFLKELKDLKEGRMSKERLMQLAMTSMDEGIFDQRGKIDVLETFKRGNIPVAASVATGRAAKTALPYLLKGVGIAALPLDLVLGANKTGMDPQEEIAQAMGISPNLLYNMPEEEFAQIESMVRQTMAARAKQNSADAQSVDATVP